MDTFIQQLLNGLVLGSLYATIALGYTMVYGILNLINFAHGDVLMIGALSALSAITWGSHHFPGMPNWALILLGTAFSIPVSIAVSLLIERFAYRPLRKAPRLAPLISAIGTSMVLQTIAMLIWGRSYLHFPQLISTQPIMFGQVIITQTKIAVVAISGIMMALLIIIVNKTQLGRAMRATAENPQIAQLMGINPNHIIAATFAIGAALASIAGILMGLTYSITSFTMGFVPGLKAFTAAVLGGIGNIPGAVLGGFTLGMIEALGSGYMGDLTHGVFGSNYQDIFAFIVLCGVLTIRPTGLLGERVADRG